MAAEKPRIIEIRDFLVPGHHDALLAVMHSHSRRAGNQLVLSISEACIGVWPLGLSDYEPAREELQDRQRIKVTIREDRHPNLYRLYQSIGLGSKGQVFLNLFNRHMSLKEANPDAVNEAVMKMHEMLMASRGGESGQVLVTPQPVMTAKADLEPMSLTTDVKEAAATQPSFDPAPAPQVVTQTDVKFVADPMAAVPITF